MINVRTSLSFVKNVIGTICSWRRGMYINQPESHGPLGGSRREPSIESKRDITYTNPLTFLNTVLVLWLSLSTESRAWNCKILVSYRQKRQNQYLFKHVSMSFEFMRLDSKSTFCVLETNRNAQISISLVCEFCV